MMTSSRVIDRKVLLERISSNLYEDSKKVLDAMFDTSFSWLRTDGRSLVLGSGPLSIAVSPSSSSSSSSSSSDKKRTKGNILTQRRVKSPAALRLPIPPKVPYVSIIKPKYTEVQLPQPPPQPRPKLKLKANPPPPPPSATTTTTTVTTTTALPSTPQKRAANEAYTGIQFKVASPSALKQGSAVKKGTVLTSRPAPSQTAATTKQAQNVLLPHKAVAPKATLTTAAGGSGAGGAGGVVLGANTRIQESPRAASHLKPIRLIDTSSFASPQSTNASVLKSAFTSTDKKKQGGVPNLTPIQKKGSDILSTDDENSVMAIDDDIGDDENDPSNPFSGSLSTASFDVSRDSDDDGPANPSLSECPFCHKEYPRSQLASHVSACKNVEQKKLAKKAASGGGNVNDTSLSTEINRPHLPVVKLQQQQQQQQQKQMIKTPVKSVSKPAVPPPSTGKGYIISDYHDSEDEYDSGEEFQKKKHRVPEWAKEGSLEAALKQQESTDPDKIFSCQKSCNLEDIFSPSVLGCPAKTMTVETSITEDPRKRYCTKRDSSGFWTKDKTTWKEELDYKKQMGYVPAASSIPLPFFK